MRLAVVVVTYNNTRTISACVESAARFLSNTSTTIIMVDNASADRTVTIARRSGCLSIILQSDTNIGFGAANNLAMRSVNADYYFLLNSDAYLQDGSLFAALKYLDQNPSVGIAGIPLIYPDGSPADISLFFQYTFQVDASGHPPS